MLRELGHVLRENKRMSDIACRFGGEEFVLVLLDSPLEASCQHLEKIRSRVNELQVRFREQLLGTMTLSVGIVEALRHNLTSDELLGAVDGGLCMLQSVPVGIASLSLMLSIIIRIEKNGPTLSPPTGVATYPLTGGCDLEPLIIK